MAAVTVTGDGRGETVIDEKVVSRIVVAALESVPGSAGRRSGLGALTGRNYPRVDLSFDTLGDGVAVNAEIAVQWPAPVRAVAATSRDTVATWLRRALGARPVHVNVRVARVVTPEEGEPSVRVTRGDLLAFDPNPGCREIVRVERVPVPVRVERATELVHPETPAPADLVHPEPSGAPDVLHPQASPAPEPAPVRVVASPLAPAGGVVHVDAPAPRDPVPVEVRPASWAGEGDVVHVAAPEPREPVEVRVVSRARDIAVEAPEPRPTTLIPTPRGPRMRDVLTPRGISPTIRPTAPAPRPSTPVVRPKAAPVVPEVPEPRVITPRARPLQVVHPTVVPGSGLPAARRRKEATR
ncbi:Asp23/Gls24 family envelope stress response protein [Corynebacterium sp. 335C]